MVTAIQGNLQEIESGISHLSEKIGVLSEASEKRNEINQKLLACERRMSDHKSNIINLSNLNARLEKQISTLSAVTDNEEDIKFNIRELSNKIVAFDEQLTEYEREAKLQDLASMLLKDGGIKTNIIKQYIPVFNHLINKYLDALGLFVSFELDENFNESVKSRHRDEFTYEHFSEGQKARINLAILFAWREVAALKNSASANILVLDEVLDSSMDSEGTESLTNLLTTQQNGGIIYVISHANQDSFEHIFERKLEVKLVNGYSEITES
jgi:DNA repair exonuclease SbcCD ATPase subunit